jgi:ubiquinone/menaquinone biosynthesis C-methylase UbiE
MNQFKLHKVIWTREKIRTLWQYYENISDFHKIKFLGEDFYINLLNYVKKFIKTKGKLLDISCGVGTLINILYKRGYECYATTLVDESLKMLKEKFASTNISFYKAEITNLPFEDNFFDYVFATEILEHLLTDDLILGLKEVKRILKPFGKFIITTPYKEDLQEVICPDCGAVFNPGQHLQSFNEKNMKEILENIGLYVEYCKLVPKIPLSNNFLKDSFKKLLAFIDKRIISFMYGSIFITVATKK